MNNKLQIRRAVLLLVLMGAAFAGLGYRLVDLQILRHDELSAKAAQNTQREYRQAARRGDILDANGNILATSVPVKTICADPSLIGTQALMVADVIAPLLQLDRNAIAQKLTPRSYLIKNSEGQIVTNQLHYVRLAKNVPEPTWQKVYAAMTNLAIDFPEKKPTSKELEYVRDLRLHSIFAESDQLRVYPNGPLASQVIGFSSIEETNVDGRFISKIVGSAGMERYLQNPLSGVAGWRVTETDKAQHEVVGLRDEDVYARDGLDVVLTIDSAVQHIVEDELAKAYDDHSPVSISGIVLRPRTGEILAMGSLPEFNPNDPKTINSNTSPDLCISGVMEPGSTFKTIALSAAINDHVFTMDDSVFCENGLFAFAGLRLHDSEGHHFGNLHLWEVLQKSSNIGAVKVALKLGAPRLHDYMMAYGLGAPTGITLPHEAGTSWLVPSVESFRTNKYLIAQVPMGQGLAVTRLQMAMVISTIANDGVLMHPVIVKQLQNHDGGIVQQYQPEVARRVISADTAHKMVGAMKTVVEQGGTAPLAALAHYTVAGKTGTAQAVVNHHYANDRFVVSFIGFFPADNPQICISVVMDSPKEGGHAFGGALCGPVFKNIAERCASYLNITPDRDADTNAPSLMAATNSGKIKTQ